jgi:hypothetical protein
MFHVIRINNLTCKNGGLEMSQNIFTKKRVSLICVVTLFLIVSLLSYAVAEERLVIKDGS